MDISSFMELHLYSEIVKYTIEHKLITNEWIILLILLSIPLTIIIKAAMEKQ